MALLNVWANQEKNGGENSANQLLLSREGSKPAKEWSRRNHANFQAKYTQTELGGCTSTTLRCQRIGYMASKLGVVESIWPIFDTLEL